MSLSLCLSLPFSANILLYTSTCIVHRQNSLRSLRSPLSLPFFVCTISILFPSVGFRPVPHRIPQNSSLSNSLSVGLSLSYVALPLSLLLSLCLAYAGCLGQVYATQLAETVIVCCLRLLVGAKLSIGIWRSVAFTKGLMTKMTGSRKTTKKARDAS